MKNFFLLFFLLLIYQAKAQISDRPKFEHGLVFSGRMDADDAFSFRVNGYGLEGGYYLLKNTGRKSMLSLELRLAYGRSDRDYRNLIVGDNYSFLDTIQNRLTGTASYRNVSLALPLKYRIHLFQKPVYLLLGISPYINLINQSRINYDLVEYNRITMMSLSEMHDLEDELKQRMLNLDFLLAGFGYKKDKVMFDIYFSAGATYFDDSLIGFMDKLSIVFNGHYQLGTRN